MPISTTLEPYFEHDCLICGQHLRMRYGELHDCPGDRATRTPPAKFLPLPNALYEFGKKMAAAHGRAAAVRTVSPNFASCLNNGPGAVPQCRLTLPTPSRSTGPRRRLFKLATWRRWPVPATWQGGGRPNGVAKFRVLLEQRSRRGSSVPVDPPHPQSIDRTAATALQAGHVASMASAGDVAGRRPSERCRQISRLA